jgi:hypothetical protein
VHASRARSAGPLVLVASPPRNRLDRADRRAPSRAPIRRDAPAAPVRVGRERRALFVSKTRARERTRSRLGGLPGCQSARKRKGPGRCAPGLGPDLDGSGTFQGGDGSRSSCAGSRTRHRKPSAGATGPRRGAAPWVWIGVVIGSGAWVGRASRSGESVGRGRTLSLGRDRQKKAQDDRPGLVLHRGSWTVRGRNDAPREAGGPCRPRARRARAGTTCPGSECVAVGSSPSQV